MLYTYYIGYLINPKSGFDLARHNEFLSKFKKSMSTIFSENQNFLQALDSFGKDHEGKVVDTLVIETDFIYEDNIGEITRILNKKIPGIEVISHTLVKAVSDTIKSEKRTLCKKS